MRPDLFLATIGRGSNGSNALEVTEDRAAVTAESENNIINRVNALSIYSPSWHYVPGIGKAGTAYAEVPGSATGDLTFTRASSKTRTNAAGVVETIAANVPPHDYRNADGTLSTFPRLNLEPQRTNSIRNSSMVGAVAGTPGTIPTNWANVLSGLTQTVVGVGTENGLPYIDFRFNGTATSTTCEIRFETNTQIAALTGQVWTLATYAKVINGTFNSSLVYMFERTSAGTFVASGAQVVTITSTLQRLTYTRTLSGGATVGAVQPAIGFVITTGQSYDFTIRIAAPQMELGAYATTWVPTTTAAVTRVADDAFKTGASSLIGQGQGSIFAQVLLPIPSQNGAIIQLDTGDSTNRIIIGAGPTVNIGCINAGSNFTLTVTGNWLVGTNKIAISYSASNITAYLNGVNIGSATPTAGTFPTATLTQINLGSRITAGARGAYLGSGISEAALINTRLTNTQLAQLTTL